MISANQHMTFDYLDLTKTHFEHAPDGTLRVVIEGDKCGLRVEARRAFPLSHDREHISLSDGAGNEVGVLRALDELTQPARGWIEELLERRYFLPQVLVIHGITERFGSSVWDLETDRGRVTVSTRQMHESVHEVEPNRFLITDAENNRYEIKDLRALDEKSQARFVGKY
jgi:hypothetical protein